EPASTRAISSWMPPTPAAMEHAPIESHDSAQSHHDAEDVASEETVMGHGGRWGRAAAAAAVLVALSTGGGFAARRYFMSGTPTVPTGTLSINSNPPGAQVIVDGDSRGVTPLAVSLKAGSHVVELRGAGEPRTVPVTIAAGAQVSQYIELPKA